jgi:ABC-type transport system substrate-binding protein
VRSSAIALLLTGALGLAACSDDPDRPLARDTPSTARPGPDQPAVAPTTVVSRPRGGTVRVGVWGLPDVAAPTLGGLAVRQLVLPQLFSALPSGGWAPMLVAAGTDELASDRRSATFRIAAGAAWSNGVAITAEDLRRSADKRFVAGIDGPAADGTITVRFTQPLPGWRRLWSGLDSISAPAEGVWGGPFVLAGSTPGLEVVLRPNSEWWGSGPFLDEVRLVLVPDQTTARQLLERDELDVVMPPAGTARASALERIDGVEVDSATAGGWWVGLAVNPARVKAVGLRRALFATVDRRRFIDVLLTDEAAALGGFAAADDSTWPVAGAGDAGGLRGAGEVELSGTYEEPMTGLLQRAMQKRVRPTGATLELRNAESHRVEGWVATGDYDAALLQQLDSPALCWTCRWGAVDGDLAAAADAGETGAAAQLEARLRDEGLLLPLWRPRTLVAWRTATGLHGVTANGWAASAAWNAADWWIE